MGTLPAVTLCYELGLTLAEESRLAPGQPTSRTARRSPHGGLVRRQKGLAALPRRGTTLRGHRAQRPPPRDCEGIAPCPSPPFSREGTRPENHPARRPVSGNTDADGPRETAVGEVNPPTSTPSASRPACCALRCRPRRLKPGDMAHGRLRGGPPHATSTRVRALCAVTSSLPLRPAGQSRCHGPAQIRGDGKPDPASDGGSRGGLFRASVSRGLVRSDFRVCLCLCHENRSRLACRRGRGHMERRELVPAEATLGRPIPRRLGR